VIDYIRSNAPWIFSGIGVAILGFIFSIFRKRSVSQKQKTTNGSLGIQAGNDINLNTHDHNKND
jgi:hypothetical protein